jgi:hypothetical protein
LRFFRQESIPWNLDGEVRRQDTIDNDGGRAVAWQHLDRNPHGQTTARIEGERLAAAPPDARDAGFLLAIG